MFSGKQKAVVAAVLGALVGFLSTLSGALGSGGDLTAEVWINAVIAAILGSGLSGGATWKVENKSKGALPPG